MDILKILFIVFWLLGLIYGGYTNRADSHALGHFGLTWLLLLLLGLAVFKIV